MEQYLRETLMLNFSDPNIQRLVSDGNWKNADEFNRIKQIYNFVRDEMLTATIYNIGSLWPGIAVRGKLVPSTF